MNVLGNVVWRSFSSQSFGLRTISLQTLQTACQYNGCIDNSGRCMMHAARPNNVAPSMRLLSCCVGCILTLCILLCYEVLCLTCCWFLPVTSWRQHRLWWLCHDRTNHPDNVLLIQAKPLVVHLMHISKKGHTQRALTVLKLSPASTQPFEVQPAPSVCGYQTILAVLASGC